MSYNRLLEEQYILNIFADYIHNDLYHSLHLLFEKRLKMNLFSPVGQGWDKGLLNIPVPFAKIDTIDEIRQHPDIECEKHEFIDGIHYYHRKMEPDKGYYIQKRIAFDKFLEMDFDIVLVSCWTHEEIFYKLVKKYKPNAILIRQIGNIGELPLFCRNVLWGQLTKPLFDNINYIRYHPEHHKGYRYTPPTSHNIIKSFMDDLPYYSIEIKLWNQLKSSLPNFTFRMHGRKGHDNSVPHLLMPQAMRDSAFIWHVKPHGGGGFLPRQALACGRPCIVKKHYAVQYDEPAGKLFEDGVNCIDHKNVKETVRLIKEWSEPDRHIEICKAIAKKAKRDMNFAEEARKIKAWIETLPRGV